MSPGTDPSIPPDPTINSATTLTAVSSIRSPAGHASKFYVATEEVCSKKLIVGPPIATTCHAVLARTASTPTSLASNVTGTTITQHKMGRPGNLPHCRNTGEHTSEQEYFGPAKRGECREKEIVVGEPTYCCRGSFHWYVTGQSFLFVVVLRETVQF